MWWQKKNIRCRRILYVAETENNRLNITRDATQLGIKILTAN
jgi:hypothetical protein